MPSKVNYWFTHHDGLSLLHVSSSDPRRGGYEELALFESDVYAALMPYQWTIRHDRIENQYGKSFLNIITTIYKLGTVQIEPGIDYRRCNIRKRGFDQGYTGGIDRLQRYREENPDWKEKTYNARFIPDCFAPIRYKSKSEWIELEVPIEGGGVVVIKINKYLVKFVPKRLVYRPRRKRSKLFLCPNKAQRQRTKKDRKHGIAFADYILEKADSPVTASHAKLLNYYDFRIDASTGEFVNSSIAKNEYRRVPSLDGVLLKITIPDGPVWDTIRDNVYPKDNAIIFDGQKRWAYFILDAALEGKLRDYTWYMYEDDSYELKLRSRKFIDIETLATVPSEQLKYFVAENMGVKVRDVIIKSRMSKYYENAVEKGNLKSRAKFENTIVSDITTTNRMFTKPKYRKVKRIYANKYVAIPDTDIIALDMRVNSLRIGGTEE